MQELLLDTAFTVSAGGALLVIILAVDYFFRARRRKRNALIDAPKLGVATTPVETVKTGSGKPVL